MERNSIMKTGLITIACSAILVLVGSSAVAYAQYDDIYITPKQNKIRQAELQKLDEEKAKERARQRELYLKKEAEEVYYNDPVDDKGFTDYEIDAYNRRGSTDTCCSQHPQKQKRQEKIAKTKRRIQRGEYTNRLRRFHSDNAIILVEGDQVYIISDDDYGYRGYCDEDCYYGGGGDTSVNIHIYGDYSSWGNYACYNFPWYDPWYDYWINPWYYSWRDPFYYYHRRPRWYFGWNAWGWNMGWGYSPWYNGYNWGYRDGFWDGYYWGAHDRYYDPYNGSYYSKRQNVYPNGRRSSESYGNSYSRGRRSNDQFAGSLSSTSRMTSRNQYARGTFWSDSRSRATDNTFSNNYGNGRNRRSYSSERGVFSRNEQGRITTGRGENSNKEGGYHSRPSRNEIDREIYRRPRREINTDRTVHSRNNYQRNREVYRSNRNSISRNSSSRSSNTYRPSSNSSGSSRSNSTYSPNRSSSSHSSSSRGSNTYRPSRNSSSSSRSNSTYSPNRTSSSHSSSSSSNRSSAGSSRNSTSRR